MKWTELEPEERKEMMSFMENQLHKSEPEVGTFFYDVTSDKLFLTDSVSVEQAPSFGLGKLKKTTRKLHPQIWNENDMKGDYTLCPRGRVFYNVQDNNFDVMVGKWAEQYPNLLNQVVKRFHLEGQNVQLKYDEHWDIGNGFGE